MKYLIVKTSVSERMVKKNYKANRNQTICKRVSNAPDAGARLPSEAVQERMSVHQRRLPGRRTNERQRLGITAERRRLNPHSRFRIRVLMNRDRPMVAAMAGCTIDTVVMVLGALRFLEPSLALGARKRFGRIVARSQITERLRGQPHELPDPTTTRTSTRQLPKQDSDDQKDPR
jgi:hypothetical protein